MGAFLYNIMEERKENNQKDGFMKFHLFIFLIH